MNNSELISDFKTNRFRVVEETGTRVDTILENLGYSKLDKQAVDRRTKTTFTFIDNKRNQFWIVDQDSLAQTKNFVESVYLQKIITVTL